jgi:hypothetical protein
MMPFTRISTDVPIDRPPKSPELNPRLFPVGFCEEPHVLGQKQQSSAFERPYKGPCILRYKFFFVVGFLLSGHVVYEREIQKVKFSRS